MTEICRRLDGIPLAIELAAARLPLLGIEGLRTHLDERFKVLTGGTRMVLRRHQTLLATLEWSHGLLTPDEQNVFRRLGVFCRQFHSRDRATCRQDELIDAWSALDPFGALVDKSLVLAEGDPVPRYRLLETTRAYSVERLAEAVETDSRTYAGTRKHYCRCSPASSDDECADAGRDGQLDRRRSELDNLRAALAWAATADDGGELAMALAGDVASRLERPRPDHRRHGTLPGGAAIDSPDGCPRPTRHASG